MFLLPMRAILELDRMRPHQELLARSWLVQYNNTMVGLVIFVSHQWLGWSHPDPANVQLPILQALLRTLMEGKTDVPSHWQAQILGTKMAVKGSSWAEMLPRMLCWLDYCSMPQPNAVTEAAWEYQAVTKAPSQPNTVTKMSSDHRFSPSGLAKDLADAVSSIPAYVERTALIIVLVPFARHADTHEVCNASSWRSRGWCRMEYLSAALARNMIPIVVCGNRPAHFTMPMDLLNLTAGGGQFTCCTRSHVVEGIDIPCDKNKVKKVLQQLLNKKVEHLFASDQLLAARLLASIRPALLRGLGPPEAPGARGSTWEAGDAEASQGGADLALLSLKERLRWGSEAQELSFEAATGFTLLHYAVCANDASAVRALLARGAKLHVRTRRQCADAGLIFNGVPPLHLAMCLADWDVSRLLLDARADPQQRFKLNAIFPIGPIEMASLFGRPELIEAWFVRFPLCGTGWGLNWAARAGNLDALRVLLAQRADPNGRLHNGVGAPLAFASGSGEDAGAATVALLLAARADPNIREVPTGRYGVACAVMRLACRAGLRSELCLMLANTKGWTPLYMAVGIVPNTDVIQLLLDARADPEATSAVGFRPLEFARALARSSGVPAEVEEALCDVGYSDLEKTIDI